MKICFLIGKIADYGDFLGICREFSPKLTKTCVNEKIMLQ